MRRGLLIIWLSTCALCSSAQHWVGLNVYNINDMEWLDVSKSFGFELNSTWAVNQRISIEPSIAFESFTVDISRFLFFDAPSTRFNETWKFRAIKPYLGIHHRLMNTNRLEWYFGYGVDYRYVLNSLADANTARESKDKNYQYDINIGIKTGLAIKWSRFAIHIEPRYSYALWTNQDRMDFVFRRSSRFMPCVGIRFNLNHTTYKCLLIRELDREKL